MQIVARPAGDIEVEQENKGLLQWSPLIHDIQKALVGLDLFHGSANGRLNNETVQAIRNYQRQYNITVDGKATASLLRHIEHYGRPNNLKEKLEAARRRQIEQARQALLSDPRTRDLINDPAPAKTSEKPAEARDCIDTPNADCLISSAVLIAATIKRNEYRDWAHRDIIQAQAVLGEITAARQTIKTITDPRLTIVSLRETVAALSQSGHTDSALSVADIIPGHDNQARALISVVAARANAGDISVSEQVIARLSNKLSQIDDSYSAADVAANLSAAVAQTPLETAALRLLQDLYITIRSRENASFALGVLATAFAQLGQIEQAQSILAEDKINTHSSAQLAIITHFTATDRIIDAQNELAKLDLPQNHVFALCQIAQAQARSNKTNEARMNLARASNAILDIERPHAANVARVRVAEAWFATAGYDESIQLLENIEDRILKAQSFWRLASQAIEIPDMPRVSAFESKALSSTYDIDSAFDRASTFLYAAALEAKSNRNAAANRLFQLALNETRGIRTPWWRARIYAKLAAMLPLLK